MQNLTGKVLGFLAKVVFILSILGAILGFVMTALSDQIPAIAEFLGVSINMMPTLGYLGIGASVVSGTGIKVSGYINQVNKVNKQYMITTNRIQKEYFEDGVDNINKQLKTQEQNFKVSLNQKQTELEQKEKELQVMTQELELKTRETAKLKASRLGIKNED